MSQQYGCRHPSKVRCVQTLVKWEDSHRDEFLEGVGLKYLTTKEGAGSKENAPSSVVKNKPGNSPEVHSSKFEDVHACDMHLMRLLVFRNVFENGTKPL